MDIETFKKWLPYYRDSHGAVLSGVPTDVARTMLTLCRENGVECELHPEGDGIWIVQIRGTRGKK